MENCCLDEEKICMGCFRAIAEIAQWSLMDDDTRRGVLLKAEERRKNYDIKKD
jgi:predicted Fe-S protein YdhL (DUF1289 family)